MEKSFNLLLLLMLLTGCTLSACSSTSSVVNEIDNTPEPQPTTALVVPTETEEIIDKPTPVIDVSEWIVTVGGLECTLEPYGNEYPGWYMADYPEQLWFPIGQTTTIEVNLLDNETCIVSPIEDFKIAIQDLSSDAMPVEFVQIEDAQWGCWFPYSDTSGLEVVCGLEVDCKEVGEELRVLIFGKTIRVYTGGSGGEGTSGGDQSSALTGGYGEDGGDGDE